MYVPLIKKTNLQHEIVINYILGLGLFGKVFKFLSSHDVNDKLYIITWMLRSQFFKCN